MTVKNDITQFRDRETAGKALAELLRPELSGPSLVVSDSLNGAPVALSVARELNLGCDLLIHDGRKCQELFRNPLLQGEASARHLKEEYRSCTGRTNTAQIAGKTVILVDEGLEDPERLLSSVDLLKSENPYKILLALPVGSAFHVKLLERSVPHVICLLTPVNFISCAQFYEHHEHLSRQEVRNLMNQNRFAA